MIQVCDYDILIVLDELNPLIYVRPLNEWQIPLKLEISTQKKLRPQAIA